MRIRNLLLVSLIPLILAIVGVTLVTSLLVFSDAVRTKFTISVDQMASVEASRISAWIDAQIVYLHGVAGLAYPLTESDDLPARIVANGLSANPDLRSVSFIDERGIARYTTVEGAQGVDVSGREYYAKAMAGHDFVSDLSFGRINGNPLVFISVPVSGVTGPTGLIVASLSLDTIAAEIRNGARDSLTRLILVDSMGRVIADSESADDGPPVTPENVATITTTPIRSTPGVYENDYGRRVIGVRNDLPAGNLSLIAEVGLDSLVESLKDALIIAGSTSAVLVVLAILIVFILARRISFGLEQLVSATQQVSAGSYGLTLEPRREVGRPQELDVLTLHFNDMSLAIKSKVEELQAISDDLERSNRDLNQFAYAASHDLNEPLRMIISYIQLLERRLGPDLDGDSREFFGYVEDGAQRLRQLINALLEYARVDTRFRPQEEVDLTAIAREATQNLHMYIRERGGEVYFSNLPTVRSADPTLMLSLLQNLIQNGIKYNESDIPFVRIETVGTRYGEVRISVEDNGIGIPRDQRERAFEMFHRLHPRDRYEGAGVGLALCRRIAERHGGRVILDDGPGGRGTRVIVVLREQEDHGGRKSNTDPYG